MSYLVLARKYRPHDFEHMVGQEHVRQALHHALEKQRLHHAYLFTGTRGVGKTSIARIFAKCLNCEHGISATPCGECSACQDITAGRYVDLLEIDAASNTGVEKTRDLLDNVQYRPQRGRYKVYIIDEVHMLSGASFNALLKTLEEPPPHVKFLLATTDPQRLPVTVLSRCLQFHLKSMTPRQIEAQLATILNQENIDFELPALPLLAKAAKGSMRDALSLLDQAIAYSNGRILEESTSQMLGLVGESKITALIESIADNKPEELLNHIQSLALLGADFLAVLDDMLQILQELAVIQLLPETQNPSSPLAQLAQKISREDVQLYYQIATLGKRDLPFAPDPQTGFTMIMIRMIAFTPKASVSSSRNAAATNTASPVVRNTPEQPVPDNNWANIAPALKLSGVAQLLANNCSLKKHDENLQQIELILDENQKALLNPATQERLSKALQDYFGKPYQLSIAVGKTEKKTPAQLQEASDNARKKSLEQSVLSDPHVQTLVQKFSATLHTDT